MLTRQEVNMLLGTVQGVNWIMASLLYGASRRLLACLRLRVKGIDFSGDQTVVWEGKCNKNKITTLPAIVQAPLVWHVEYVHILHEHDFGRGVGRVCLRERLGMTVGLIKPVSCHTLRHAFATHLLEDGYDIQTIQERLGHRDVSTTMIYTQVLNRGGKGVYSPIDRF